MRSRYFSETVVSYRRERELRTKPRKTNNRKRSPSDGSSLFFRASFVMHLNRVDSSRSVFVFSVTMRHSARQTFALTETARIVFSFETVPCGRHVKSRNPENVLSFAPILRCRCYCNYIKVNNKRAARSQTHPGSNRSPRSGSNFR